MAKRLIYLAAAAFALTACTSEDVIDDVKTAKNNVIKFENVVNKPSRADITSETLSHFNVFGFYTMPGNDQKAHQVFYNIDVDKKVVDGETTWDYESKYGERYWVPGAKYYFYAYSCDNKIISEDMSHGINYTFDMDGEKDANDRVLGIQSYVCDNVHQHDLVFATNNTGIIGQDYGNNTNVALQFKHILSKVKAQFTTEFPDEYQIVISDLSIVDICDKGNYDYNSKWHDVGKTVEAKDLVLPVPAGEFMVKNTGAENPMSIATNPVYVIPNDSEVALQFTIDVYIGADRTEKVMSKTLTGKFTPTWQEGYQYVYNVVINGTTTQMDVIVFTTTVDEFGNADITDQPGPTKFDVTNNPV